MARDACDCMTSWFTVWKSNRSFLLCYASRTKNYEISQRTLRIRILTLSNSFVERHSRKPTKASHLNTLNGSESLSMKSTNVFVPRKTICNSTGSKRRIAEPVVSFLVLLRRIFRRGPWFIENQSLGSLGRHCWTIAIE